MSSLEFVHLNWDQVVCGADKRGKAVRLGSKRPGAWLRHGFSSQDPVPALDFDFFCIYFGYHEISLGLEIKILIILGSV